MYINDRFNPIFPTLSTLNLSQIKVPNTHGRRSQWPSGLKRMSTAACLLRLWLRIPLGVWMSVNCECCMLSGRGLCGELITLPEESYGQWYIVVCVI